MAIFTPATIVAFILGFVAGNKKARVWINEKIQEFRDRSGTK